MKQEVKEYAEMSNEFETLVHFFRNLAVDFLQKICDQLVKLYYANIYFLECLYQNEEAVNAMIVGLDDIINLVTVDSERIRRQNAKVCQEAVKSIQQIIECIEKIKSIDILYWMNPTNLVQYSDNGSVLPALKDK
jgi:hypothetical protein